MGTCYLLVQPENILSEPGMDWCPGCVVYMASSVYLSLSLADDVENLQLRDGHLTTLLHQSLLDDVNSFDFNSVTKAISSLMSQLKDISDSTGSASSSPVQLSVVCFCTQILASSIPLLHQYLNLSQNLLLNLLAAHRATSKLLSVLLSIFTELASKGFCLPPEIEEGEGDGATEFEDIEGGGIGEGEGMKDVSDQIENEEQVYWIFNLFIFHFIFLPLMLLFISTAQDSNFFSLIGWLSSLLISCLLNRHD